QLGLILKMICKNAAVIHAIELIAAENQGVVKIDVQEMYQVLPHRVGGALIPRCVGGGLLSREDFDETSRKMIELVRLRDMAMQRRRVELGQKINAFEPGVDAV